MNLSDFTYLIKNPEKCSVKQLQEIKEIIDKYPYFYLARATYLKIIKHQDRSNYDSILKRIAAHTTDRSVLFDLITSNLFLQQRTASEINKKSAEINAMEVRSETLIVEEVHQETSAVLDPDLFYPKVSANAELTENITDELASEIQNNLETSSEANSSGFHSFAEWLKLSTSKTIDDLDYPLSEDTTKTRKREKFDLIDEFIAKNPKIIPRKEKESSFSIAKSNNVSNTDLMTETLAKIYLEQKKFKKAIQAYKILSLKYPEKSGFFADQIKAVKKLQQNN